MNIAARNTLFLSAMSKLQSGARQDEQGNWQCSWCRDFKESDQFEGGGSLCCLDCVRREREMGP